MNGLLWRVYRRCGCPLCLAWPARAAAWTTAACLAVLWTATAAWASGLGWPTWLLIPAAVTGCAAVVLAAWPAADHAGDDLEALIQVIRGCRACSPEDYGPCTCKDECGSIRCAAGFPARPDRELNR